MRWVIYNILFAILFVLFLPHYLLRMRRRGGYRRNFLQRLACYDSSVRTALSTDQERIWIHAVSVGELFVAFKFIEALRQWKPSLAFVLTTTTSTGHAIASKRIAAPDVLLYFPVDFPVVMKRALRAIKPSMLLLVECECWPNLIRSCSVENVPVVMVNGRLSDSSFKGYKKIRFFMRDILSLVRVFCMQTEEDREKMVALGAPAHRVFTVGNAKYELFDRDKEKESDARMVLDQAGFKEGEPLLVGGSTWSGEEKILLELYKSLRLKQPNLHLLLAPRHVERIPEVLPIIEEMGLSYAKRTEISSNTDPVDVIVLDTTGELRHYYAHATVNFIGKSLCSHGGQNIIEPAFYGKPIIVGPYTENFTGIISDFIREEALIQLSGASELGDAVLGCLQDSDRAGRMGERAAEIVRRQAGSVSRTIQQIQRMAEDPV